MPGLSMNGNTNFNARLEAVRELGFSTRFIRKWHYYLKYCEAAFARGCPSDR